MPNVLTAGAPNSRRRRRLGAGTRPSVTLGMLYVVPATVASGPVELPFDAATAIARAALAIVGP